MHDRTVVGRMSQLGHKRKLASKSITEKYKIPKEVDKDNSCAFVAKKLNIPKQTLSNWLKKKKQIMNRLIQIHQR